MFRKKPTTVDAVLSAFTNTLQELADVAAAKRDEADACDDEVADLRSQIAERETMKHLALTEHERAITVRDRLAALVGEA